LTNLDLSGTSTYLIPGLLWAYRNTPHKSTGEKPSFLLFGFDCRSPTEAALLPPENVDTASVPDYRRELMLSLSSAREIAAKSIRRAQKRYKSQYDKKQVTVDLEIGDWVFVRFPQEESGHYRKPCHGPYRIISIDHPNVSVVKVYFSQDPSIQVHLSRVQCCPLDFPAGYYWYGSKRRGPGRPPKWVDQLLSGADSQDSAVADVSEEASVVPETEDTSQEIEESSDRTPMPESSPPCRYPLRSRSRRAT